MSESYEDDSDDIYIEYGPDENYLEKLDIAKDVVYKLRCYAWSHGLNMLMSDKSAETLVELIH